MVMPWWVVAFITFFFVTNLAIAWGWLLPIATYYGINKFLDNQER